MSMSLDRQASSKPEAKILCVSDAPEPRILELLDRMEATSVDSVSNGTECCRTVRASSYSAIVANFPLPDCTPDELLAEIRRIDPSVPVLIRDPMGAVADAVRLTKAGAGHVFGVEFDPQELEDQIEAARESQSSRDLAALHSALDPRTEAQPAWRKFLVGNSDAMNHVFRIIELVGQKRCTVLISGETGTGKEVVARAIHAASKRSRLPMVTVNCAALPENLLEAELFGHVRGAFTGATGHRVGRFEQASNSTIFLDEIGEMPIDLQAKLLRALQEREFQRIGSSETVSVDVRIIAASNVDLAKRVDEGKFREDLFYRLNVVPIRTPPLRERPSDIPALVQHLMQKICRLEQIPAKQVSPQALWRLAEHGWPGNVRQLENVLEAAIALSGDRQSLCPADFPFSAAESRLAMATAAATISVPDHGLDFDQTVSQFERSILMQALEKTSGNKKQAADMLGLKRTTLSAKLRTFEAA
jgi:DNA-binding NtrC family response regulator